GLGRQRRPGRAGIAAAVLPAPGAEVGPLPHPDPRLLAVRRRNPSRRRDHGGIRPAGRASDRRCRAMTARAFDVAVVGGGANGMVAAGVLGRAGLRVALPESAEALGGKGRLVEFAPGFRAAPLGLDSGWLPPVVARALGLERLKRRPGGSVSV